MKTKKGIPVDFISLKLKKIKINNFKKFIICFYIKVEAFIAMGGGSDKTGSVDT